MKKRGIYVFDLDGTLVDSMPYFTRGILSVADEWGIKYTGELIKILTPLGSRGRAEYYINELGVDEPVDDLVKKFENRLYKEYSTNIKPKAGVGEYLTSLHSEGARLFVLTASPHLVTDVCLRVNGLYDLFEQIWSVDDFGLKKDGTELFFKVTQKIGCLPSDVQYFDDSLIALTNAGKAGYRTYGVFDNHSQEDLCRMRSIAQETVMTFEDLL